MKRAFERQGAKGTPKGQGRWYEGVDERALVKPHIVIPLTLMLRTGAASHDLAETHPAEGMTKVIPACQRS